MARLLNNLANGFACLAIALLVLSVLAVPTQYARADDPIECTGEGGGSFTEECPDGWECVNGACQVINPSCPNPTTDNCPGKSPDMTCYANGCSNATNQCGCSWLTYQGPGGPIEFCYCP
jgi:hypothetical protein